jgi:hypothetical protein
VERIVLIGGPCSGQIRDVEVGAADTPALGADGKYHVYVRGEDVDVGDDVHVVIFRPAVSHRHGLHAV